MDSAWRRCQRNDPRAQVWDVDNTNDGLLRLINNFSAVAFWVVAAAFAQSGKRTRIISAKGLILAVFALNAILMPAYASSRTDAALTLVVGFAIMYAVRPRRHSLRALILVGVGLMLLVSTMTMLRTEAQLGTVAEASTVAIRDAAADTLVFNRNFGDMVNASHVINHVPTVIPFQNGKTIAGLCSSPPIPRSAWPDKPAINAGPLLANYIYGEKNSGVPTGLIGGLYLDFGYGGVLVGVLLVGRLLCYLDRWRQRHVGDRSVGFALVYVPIAFVFTLGVMNKGLGAAVYHSAVQLFVVAATMLWVGAIRRYQPPHEVAASIGQPRPTLKKP